MKKIFSLVLVFALMLSLTACDFDVSSIIDGIFGNKEPAYVYNAETKDYTAGGCTIKIRDLGKVFSETEKIEIVESIAKYCKDINYKVLVLTANDLRNQTIKQYAVSVADEIFPEAKDRIVFAYSTGDQGFYIYTSGYAKEALTIDENAMALDKTEELRKEGKIVDAFKEMMKFSMKELEDGEVYRPD